jgi:hypothetical protein
MRWQPRRSVMRCLELLEDGLVGAQTIPLEVEDEWEARMFASLCLQPSYVASFPVSDLASGEVRTLTLPSLSRIEAAFLAHTICCTGVQSCRPEQPETKHPQP